MARKKTMFPALTGVRALTAVSVVLLHFWGELVELAPALPQRLPWIGQGFSPSLFFFILSGFILSHVYFDRDEHYGIAEHTRFIVQRFSRLWPLHIATISFLFLLRTVESLRGGYSDRWPLDVLPAELLMIRSWFSSDLVWNFPVWAMQAEWFAYIFLFPIAVHCIRKVQSLSLLAVILIGMAIIHPYLDSTTIPGKIDSILLPFLIGSALYRFRTLLTDFSGHWLFYCGCALAFAATQTGFPPTAIILSFCFAILGLSYDGFATKTLSRPTFVYGGTISYAVYMTHEVVHKVWSEVIKHIPIESELLSYCAASILLSSALIVGALAHHSIEVPANTILRRFLLRPKKVVVQSAS